MSTALIVIPARYGSSRFPGKPLALIAGVSLIERVYRLCTQVKVCTEVVVATDDERIRRHVRDFGGEVMMTRSDHPSGTDRVAEVARRFRASLIINVQGDEPLLDPRVIGRLIRTMRRQPGIPMATLCHAIRDEDEYRDSNAVKVVMGQAGNALYFSRAPIPWLRTKKFGDPGTEGIFRHIGIYGFRREFLFQYVQWPQSFLEKAEQLEQLRAVERGVAIHVLKTEYRPIGVDVPADVARVEKVLRKG
jgi:3-deoxy-manno-octulosonate cytidylyltransferase (CMP-KDO synthetase)